MSSFTAIKLIYFLIPENKIVTSVLKTPKLQNAAMLQPELAPSKLKQPAKPTNFILDF